MPCDPAHSSQVQRALRVAIAAAKMAEPQSSTPVGPDHPEHPDHWLFEQIRDGVRTLDAMLGREHDEASERMAARLLPLAKEHGFDQIDHVVLSRHIGEVGKGENVFVVCGELDDPAHLRAHVSTQEAVETPVDASLALLQKVNFRLALRSMRR